MQPIIEEGRNIENALEKALKRLDVSRDQINYEIIREGKKGFLGFIGARPAIVKVWLKDEDKPTKNKIRANDTLKYKQRKSQKTNRRFHNVHSGRYNHQKEGEKIKERLATILDKMGFEANISVSRRNAVFFYRIDIDEKYEGLLIGKKGATLGALQHILNRMNELSGNGNRKQHIVLDISGYRERRDRELIARANILARKVKMTGNEIVLEPLNSSDRRVIHQALRTDSDVRTYTVGEGQNRTLIIAPVPAN